VQTRVYFFYNAGTPCAGLLLLIFFGKGLLLLIYFTIKKINKLNKVIVKNDFLENNLFFFEENGRKKS
jgi:hypothetical protein